MDHEESPFTESEKAMRLDCAKAIEVSDEVNLQEVNDYIITKRGNDPALMMKATSS
jgi:hypothetical protein